MNRANVYGAEVTEGSKADTKQFTCRARYE